jgi:hypothetical protein
MPLLQGEFFLRIDFLHTQKTSPVIRKRFVRLPSVTGYDVQRIQYAPSEEAILRTVDIRGTFFTMRWRPTAGT